MDLTNNFYKTIRKETDNNELLLKERYAVIYNGGTKIKPNSWVDYKLTGKLK